MELPISNIPLKFNPLTISKYFKNQNPFNEEGEFVDPFFPPNENSILAKDYNGDFIDKIDGPIKSQEIDANNIEWKRFSHIFPKFLLFDEKIEFSDIKQGILGNCYFLSVIAALTEVPEMIYQLFRTKSASSNGYYELVLFIDGEWQIVILDDYIPVKKGTNNFAFANPNGFELWVLLVEKAWAKVNGGYINTITGWAINSFQALTGCPVSTYIHNNLLKDDLWKILKTSDYIDNIMCVSTIEDKSIEEKGLVVSHAYSLIDAKDVNVNGDIIKLLKIRNPWGYKEWNGEWSDNSPKWTEELKELLGYTGEDDGTFFISYEDFLNLFERTHVCNIMYGSNVRFFKYENEELSGPLLYSLYLPENTQFSVSAITRHWRFNRSCRNLTQPISIVISRYDLKTKQLYETDGSFNGEEYNEYTNLKLKKGLYSIWIYMNHNQCDEPKPNFLIIRFMAPCKYSVKYEKNDSSFEFLGEMILAGCKAKYYSEYQNLEVFNYQENSFRDTGISYKFIVNKLKNSWQYWESENTGFDNVSFLPPFENIITACYKVPPDGYYVLLGMRTRQNGSYWFKLNSTYWTNACEEGEDPTNTSKINLLDFISIELLQEDNYNQYDYITLSHDMAKIGLKFSHIDLNEVNLEELKKEYPELISRILELEPLKGYYNLNWKKKIHDNGYYIGEMNSSGKREGRGAYYWSGDKEYYIGYWVDDIQNVYGVCTKFDFSPIYKSEIKNNLKNGKGIFYYSDGGRYDGEFLNNLRHGKGVYYWNNGSRWEGNFEEDLFKGNGIMYTAEGESYEYNY